MHNSIFAVLLAPLVVLGCSGDDSSTPIDASTGDATSSDAAKSDASTSDAAVDGSAAACAAPATCVGVSDCAAGKGHLTPGSCGNSFTACCTAESACPTEDFYCCDATAQFRPDCVGGALVCTSPLKKCTDAGASDAATGG